MFHFSTVYTTCCSVFVQFHFGKQNGTSVVCCMLRRWTVVISFALSIVCKWMFLRCCGQIQSAVHKRFCLNQTEVVLPTMWR